jgi:cytochrome c oxidase assembly protein subunit 15
MVASPLRLPPNMPANAPLSRNPDYKPALAVFAAIAAAWVYVAVSLGAFTTTINAGMAFADWPLSNGSVNPKGWLTNLSMFAEHSHRLSAATMGLLTGVLALWLWRRESRPWLRKLAYFAFGLVVAQGLVGGLRVLLDQVHVGSLETSLGRLFAMLHACLAQAFACTLVAIAVSCSRGWIKNPRPVGRRLRRIGVACCVILFLQLAIGAVVRHSFAGLAIPTFPWSTPQGGLLPAAWDFRVGIHFAHRVMACLVALAIATFAVTAWNDRGSSTAMRAGASALVALVALQIFLGASIILTYRAVAVTTGHVLVGALTLVSAFWLTWVAHRDAVERPLSR